MIEDIINNKITELSPVLERLDKYDRGEIDIDTTNIKRIYNVINNK